MTTLFSPVGTADPITQLGDGPMLHIVRNRRPDRVVLYMSPAMAAFQQADERYTKAIELLAESLKMPAPEIELIESRFEEVYRFDRYIEEFEPLLKQYAGADEALLVNASSGTAGMAQALVALGSFGRLNLELLQVITPKKGINGQRDREDPNDYDLDALWEFDCEIERDAACRIVAVRTPNFSERLLRENVIALCRNFEYEAAFGLVQQMGSASAGAKRMIEAAAARLNLDGALPAKVFGGTDLGYKANDLLVEYLYAMEVRLEQGHWAEFMRALSPALTELMKKSLRAFLPEESYVQFKDGKPTQRYNVSAIDSDSRLAEVLYPCHYRNEGAFISNDAYARLVKAYCGDRDVAEKIDSLRYVERKSRNSLAHSLRASTRGMIEKECDMSLNGIMETLFELHGSAKPGLYGRINEAIVAAL